MYNSRSVADAIKREAKNNNISVKQVLEQAGLGANTMSNFKTSMPKADNLAKIADILDCSVDYLLGRTETPVSSQSILSEKEEEIIKIFRSLNPDGQEIVLNTILGIAESGRYKKHSEVSEKIS